MRPYSLFLYFLRGNQQANALGALAWANNNSPFFAMSPSVTSIYLAPLPSPLPPADVPVLFVCVPVWPMAVVPWFG